MLEDWPRVAALTDRAVSADPDLPERMADAVLELPFYRPPSPVSRAEVLASCRAQVEHLENASEDGGQGVARAVGAERARDGVALTEVLAAYRVGARRLWEALAHQAEVDGADTADTVELASQFWSMYDRFARAVEEGHRDVQAVAQLRQRDDQSSVVDAIVHATDDDASWIWDALDRIGLPRAGGYVVIVAVVGAPGVTPMPHIRRALERRRLPSAWLVRANLQVGLVSTATDPGLSTLVEELAATDATVGISPVEQDWTVAPRVFRFAAAAARAAPSGRANRFEQRPVHTVAGAAPDIAGRVAGDVLGAVTALTDGTGATLLSTVRAWFDADGSATGAAGALFLHPNTVRNRVHRFEELTHRSLGRPSDVAAIAVALAALDGMPAGAEAVGD